MYRGAFFGRQHPCHVCAMVRHPWHEGRLHMLPRLKKKNNNNRAKHPARGITDRHFGDGQGALSALLGVDSWALS